MSDIQIKVENLSKVYQLGVKESKSDSLGGAIASTLKSPFRNFKRLRGITPANADDDQSVLWALRDVSFDVKQGEVLGIVGRNGAGKSTLLKILSRITLPSKGEITIHGRMVSLLEVGTGFHKELTGRENVYMNGTILGMTKKEIDRKFDEIVTFSGVQRFIDTPVKRYSSGMQVRLAFAVAAHLEPEIMVIDEVLAVGDAEFQKRCLGKMEEVSKQGRTVLFVSHNMLAVQALCTRAILLRQGQLVSTGTPRQIVNEYLSQQGDSVRKISFNLDNAPGKEGAKLLEAEVLSEAPIYSQEAVKLRFKYYKEDAEPAHLAVTFHLFDEMATLVFVGTSVAEQVDTKVGVGYFTAECIIPKDLLLEGNYNLGRLLLVKNGGTIMYEHTDAISFEVVHKPLYAYGWMGGKEGVVGPKLTWNLNFEPKLA